MVNMLSEPLDISVVIPTRNKPEYLFITLLSFCLQALPASCFEVLVVCNGECHESSQLNSYLSEINWSFKFQLFTLKIGNLSNARNIGIEAAQGKYIVFVDDDCPVDESFLEKHIKSHSGLDNHYVIGYTRGINADSYLAQVKQDLLNKNQYKMLKQNNIPEHLSNFNNNEKSFLMSRMANAYYKNFSQDVESIHFPHWILFVLRNLSIQKEKLQLFDCGFKGWGMEDWELGYRLYKLGMRAAVNPFCLNYHLSHSTSSRQYRSLLLNCYFFIRKHPEYQAFLAVRFDPRSIDNPGVINQSLFGISLEKFVKGCQTYNEQKSFRKLLMLETVKTTAYLHLIGELPKAFLSRTLTD